jgi:hypothetical protein
MKKNRHEQCLYRFLIIFILWRFFVVLSVSSVACGIAENAIFLNELEYPFKR